MGVALHDGQKSILNECFPRGVEPMQWPYRQINIASGNRWGKSVLLAVLYLWTAVFKHRSPVPYGSEDWWTLPYTVANLCPLNDIAYVIREKIGQILVDEAKEQILRKPVRGHVNGALAALFMLNPQPGQKNPYLVRIPDTEYDGYRTLHGSYLEFRTTDDHAKAMQGRMKYFIGIDEAGREKDPVMLIANDIAPRVLDTQGLIVAVTTPHLETYGTFEDVWDGGNPENPARFKSQMSYMRSTLENPVITQGMIDELLEGQPDYLYDQIINGKFVQSEDAFFSSVSIGKAQRDYPNKTGMARERRRGHTYVCSWDLAVSKAGDRSIGVVWDVTMPPYRVVEYLEEPKGTKQDALIADMNAMLSWYSSERMDCTAIMTYDETGMGGLMFRDDLALLRPRPKPFNFAGARHKKLSILTSLKLFLDKGLLLYPKECTRITHELKRYKRSDEKLETDAVMALAMASHYAERFGRARVARTLITESLVPA